MQNFKKSIQWPTQRFYPIYFDWSFDTDFKQLHVIKMEFLIIKMEQRYID